MKKFKNPEEEVDSWKLKVAERRKNMTPEELDEYYRRNREELAKKYNFKRVKNADSAHQWR